MSNLFVKRNNLSLTSLLLVVAIFITTLCITTPVNAATTSQALVYGDVSGDGSVDSSDYTFTRRYLLGIIKTMPAENWREVGDLNLDGKIDSADYSILRRYLLRIITSIPMVSNPTTTPTSTNTPTNTPTGIPYTPNADDVSITAVSTYTGATVEVAVTLPDSSYQVVKWDDVTVAMAGRIDPVTNATSMSFIYYFNANIVKYSIPDTLITKTPRVEKFTYNASCMPADSNSFNFYVNGNNHGSGTLLKTFSFTGGLIPSMTISPTSVPYTPDKSDVTISAVPNTTGVTYEIGVTLPNSSYSINWGEIQKYLYGIAGSSNYYYYSQYYICNASIVKLSIPDAQITKTPKIEKFTYDAKYNTADGIIFELNINGTRMKTLEFKSEVPPHITFTPTPSNTPSPRGVRYTPKADDVSITAVSTSTGATVEIAVTLPDSSYKVVNWDDVTVATAAGIDPVTSVTSMSYIYDCNANIVKYEVPELQVIKIPKIEKFTYNAKCSSKDANNFRFYANDNGIKTLIFQGGLTPSITPTPTEDPYKWVSYTPTADQVSFTLEKTSTGGLVHVNITYPTGGFRIANPGQTAIAGMVFPEGGYGYSYITSGVNIESYTGAVTLALTHDTLTYEVKAGDKNQFTFDVNGTKIKYVNFDKDMKVIESL